MKVTIISTGEGVDAAEMHADGRNNQVIFKHCVPFTDCIIKMNNAQIDNVKDLDFVMLMYNLIEYTNNYSKIPGR